MRKVLLLTALLLSILGINAQNISKNCYRGYVDVGYSLEKLEFETFDRFISHTSMRYTTVPTKYDTEAIAVKLGFEF